MHRRLSINLYLSSHYSISIEALETKARVRVEAPVLEKWRKGKFGDVTLSGNKDEVLKFIESESQIDGSEGDMIDRNIEVVVAKNRTKMPIPQAIDQEFCVLRLTNPLTNEAEVWYSICIEGPKEHLRSYLHSCVYLPELMAVLVEAGRGSDPCLSTPSGSIYIPVIGGYPSWLERYAHDNRYAKADFERGLGQLHKHLGIVEKP